MPLKACTVCGAASDERRCPSHRRPSNASWSEGRDRSAQARFRREVLERDGHQCTYVDPATGARCRATTDLRACHLRPLRDFMPGDPSAYHRSNGTTRCGTHDRLTDRYAR